MKKVLFAVAVLLVLAGCSADLSTDDGVRKAWSRATGHEVHENDVGVERPGSFPGVVVVGTFAHDAGFMYDGAFVGGNWHDGLEASRPALQSAGWAEADAARRQELALQWTVEGLLAFDSVLETPHELFSREDAPAFHPPQASMDGNLFVVAFWVKEESGMAPEDAFAQVEYRFDAQGGFVERRSRDRYVVPIRRGDD